MKNDLERLQFLTRNYALMQGYPIALVGLMYVLMGIAELIWPPASRLLNGWLFLAGVGLMAIAVTIIQHHHKRKFGVVKAASQPRRELTVGAFIVLYVALIHLGGPNFKNLGVPLAPMVLNVGLMLLLAGLLPGFPWRHYAGIGLLLMAVAFLPAFHVVTVEWFWHGWNSLAVGVASLLCGAIDRLIFLRHLPSLPVEESHA